MGSVLSKYDINFMNSTVQDVIGQWDCTITVYEPLPLDKQKNYNKRMKEFNGNAYYTKSIIPAERKDIVNNYTNDLKPDAIEYGSKNQGTILFAIPDIINGEKWKPNKDSIIMIDDDTSKYYIHVMKDRIGETLIIINRYTDDSTPNVIEYIVDHNIDSINLGGDSF